MLANGREIIFLGPYLPSCIPSCWVFFVSPWPDAVVWPWTSCPCPCRWPCPCSSPSDSWETEIPDFTLKHRQLLILLARTRSLQCMKQPSQQIPAAPDSFSFSCLDETPCPWVSCTSSSTKRMTVKAQTPSSNASAYVRSARTSVGKACLALIAGLASALGYLPRILPFSSRAQKKLRFWDAHHVHVPQSDARLKYYNWVVKTKEIPPKWYSEISTTVVHNSTQPHFCTCIASVYTTDLPHPQLPLPGITHVHLFLFVMMVWSCSFMFHCIVWSCDIEVEQIRFQISSS